MVDCVQQITQQHATPNFRNRGRPLLVKPNMENMKLLFPELRGGPVQGLNDAGVENFQGAIDVYLSRECGQNTGDAARPETQTVRLEFDRILMRQEDIPGFSQLRSTLTSCLERWGGNVKEREFFEQALDLASRHEIDVLKISDYGTTGLTGDDVDERGRWFALVKSQGVSNKGDMAGGSFGIGKSSPFAASRFRTVFYGTRTATNSAALQGVSRLVTHKNEDGKLTQGVGFTGRYDPQGGEGGEPVFRAVRDELEIPLPFRRTELGTDIWVIGYRSGPQWSVDLIRSILSNFWPAIHRGSIQFLVGNQSITKENLEDLVTRYVGQEEFEAHHFLKAIRNDPIRKSLRHVGDCELFLTASSPDLPRKICMVRNTGMRIYDYQPKACRVPFSGLFICTDPDGNKLLRKLEPPKHDAWDPKRTDDQTGKKALDGIKSWIREEVKKLNPLFSGDSFNESELAKYIPDSAADEPNDLPNEQNGRSEEESLDPKPRLKNVSMKPIRAKPVLQIPSDEAEGEAGQGDELGGGESVKGGDSSGTAKNRGTAASPNPNAIKVRTYRSGNNQYELVLRSEENYSGRIGVYAMGEDGRHERVELQSAVLGNMESTTLSVSGDVIHDVNLVAGIPLRITTSINALGRRSLNATPRT